MKTSIKDDLVDASDALEHLMKVLPNMKLAEKVDVGARLRAICKNAEALDKAIKADIKADRDKQLSKGVKGDIFVLGELFKACVKVISCERFQQGLFKEEQPKLYKKYLEQRDEDRVSFEPR